ncbi:MAG TPA: nucleoside 2-deoxyribosyltransferase [Candidatus Saccharimonadales bacterium]|nr:nucleoside 2-deoxyribosyltransferase [Candidatus Saccharimonadales bacterium]
MIYIDSTIHHDWNRNFNPKLCQALEDLGISCYLPQRDTNQQSARQSIFDQNHKAMAEADTILAVAENESPNWGVEIGYAKPFKKRVIILAQKDHHIPTMAEFLADEVCLVDNIESITDYANKLAAMLK